MTSNNPYPKFLFIIPIFLTKVNLFFLGILYIFNKNYLASVLTFKIKSFTFKESFPSSPSTPELTSTTSG